jgi:hypothetical protein
VRPETGEPNRFEGRNRSYAEVRADIEDPWFTGVASVTCTRARILTGPFALQVNRWFLGIILALAAFTVGLSRLHRHGRRTTGDTQSGLSASPPAPAEPDPPERRSAIELSTSRLLNGAGITILFLAAVLILLCFSALGFTMANG